jgi:DNA-binding transcriptional MocR family regulator
LKATASQIYCPSFYPGLSIAQDCPFSFPRRSEAALQKVISVAPGSIFPQGDKYRNCFRLNSAFWSEQTEQALETLIGMAEEFA